MKLIDTFGLPAVLLLFFSWSCVSESTQETDSDELLDYDGLVFESADPGHDIIPDVVYNYLSEFDYPSTITTMFDGLEYCLSFDYY